MKNEWIAQQAQNTQNDDELEIWDFFAFRHSGPILGHKSAPLAVDAEFEMLPKKTRET